jgi:putative SOS response-associated peptidase YedK
MINARAETLLEKPAFRNLAKRRRCVIPASGFYEWQKRPDGKGKIPMHIRIRDQKAFGLAGLWDVWHGADGSELKTCTIITTAPNELMGPIHDRMPAVLDEAGMRRWLTPGELRDAPVDVLRPFAAEKMEAYAVSRDVNGVGRDAATMILPCVDEEPPAVQSAKKSRVEQPGLFG